MCSGIIAPYGTATPSNFVGMTSSPNGDRTSVANWWECDCSVITADPSGETVISSGGSNVLRVSEPSDGLCSAWYIRFAKTDDGITMTLFLPSGQDSPTESDFDRQLARSVFSKYINNHSSYRETVVEVPPIDEDSLGFLDTVNIFSSIKNYASSELRGIEFLSVKTFMIDATPPDVSVGLALKSTDDLWYLVTCVLSEGFYTLAVGQIPIADQTTFEFAPLDAGGDTYSLGLETIDGTVTLSIGQDAIMDDAIVLPRLIAPDQTLHTLILVVDGGIVSYNLTQ